MPASAAPPDASLDERIVVGVLRCASLLAKAGNRLALRLGLSQQQWVLLAAIARGHEDGVPLSELGRNLLVTKANITGMVDRLERDGYVTRNARAGDRRVCCARLTAKGRRFLREISPLQGAWTAEAFRGFSRAEKARFLALLDKQIKSAAETEKTTERRPAWPASRPT